MSRPILSRWHGLALVLLICVSPARGDLPAGSVLGPDNWQEAEGLLPAEFLDLYRRGDFQHRITDWRLDPLVEDPVFKAALDENAGRYDLTETGSIVDTRTGKAPAYVYGWPFPHIDPRDPKAAMKIVWNYYYTLYYGGNGHYRADLLWLSRNGLDRAIEVDALFKHYEGQHPRFREGDNPDGLLTQTLANVRSPADVSGIVSLAWRYRDAELRDSVWVYVPALRRVRQVSPANRSDGFLGSDMTQDDGAYFDGKIEDFTWRMVGEQDLLVLFDRLSLEEPAQLRRLPGDGWRMRIPGGARLGFQVPEWQGVSWCPTQEVLVRRPHWVLEAVPKDKYYLFGKIILRFDKEVFMGSYSSKYDWKGQLMASFAGVRTNIIKVAPGEFWGWAGGAVAVAINWKLDRATTAGIVVGDSVPADSRIPLSPQLFSLQSLMSKGK
jgi:hypothetical protein